MTVITHALHAVCRTGDTAMAEALFRALPESDIRQVVNRPLGSKDYVPLNNAVYWGSVNVVKILLANGADPNYTNTHGESIDDTLRAGEADMIAKLPSERIFIAETYRQSRRYLEDRRSGAPAAAPPRATATCGRGSRGACRPCGRSKHGGGGAVPRRLPRTRMDRGGEFQLASALIAEPAANEGPQEAVHDLRDVDRSDPGLDLDGGVHAGLVRPHGHVDQLDGTLDALGRGGALEAATRPAHHLLVVHPLEPREGPHPPRHWLREAVRVGRPLDAGVLQRFRW